MLKYLQECGTNHSVQVFARVWNKP